ncbi:MAG TPA: hypothetical protein VGA77_03395 [Propylenella sp.]
MRSQIFSLGAAVMIAGTLAAFSAPAEAAPLRPATAVLFDGADVAAGIQLVHDRRWRPRHRYYRPYRHRSYRPYYYYPYAYRPYRPYRPYYSYPYPYFYGHPGLSFQFRF